MTARPFRFGVNMVSFGTGREFKQRCRRAEELAYDVVHVPDHLGMCAPFSALAAAATVTERPRLGTFVLNAGLWNPALLAREVATCDQLTEGRLELGLGAGYVKAEHDRAGLPWGSPGERARHLEHTVTTLARLLADPEHEPQPRQETVPLMIGGNGDRVLRLAARSASVTSFTGARQAPGRPEGTLRLIPPDQLADRAAAFRGFAAGRTEPYELNYLVQHVALTHDRRAELSGLPRYGPDMTEEQILEHPALVMGSVKEMAEQLRAHRERFGFSYWTVLDPHMEVFAPVIEELKGS